MDKTKKGRNILSENEKSVTHEENNKSKKLNKKDKKAKALSDEEDDDDNEIIVKNAQKSIFSILANEDGDSDDDKALTESDDNSSANITQPPDNKTKKKNKKLKPSKQVDSNDKILDEIVAEFTTTNISKKAYQVPKEAPTTGILKAQEKALQKEITSDMTQEEISKLMDEMIDEDDEDDHDKKKKKKQKKVVEVDSKNSDEENEEESTVKTAAQKKKEKKERQKTEKLNSLQNKAKETKSQPSSEKQLEQKREVESDTTTLPARLENMKEIITTEIELETKQEDNDEEENKSKKPKKKTKGKDGKEEKVKKPSKLVQDILEAQKLKQAEDERLKREEEERIQREEELERQKEEKERLEREKKERKKQKEKEKIQKLKAEGKFLTEKQKEDRRRAQQLLESIRAQGVDLPQPNSEPVQQSKKVEYTKLKRPKAKVEINENDGVENKVEIEIVDAKAVDEDVKLGSVVTEEKEDVKDAWDVTDSESEDIDDVSTATETSKTHSIVDSKTKELDHTNTGSKTIGKHKPVEDVEKVKAGKEEETDSDSESLSSDEDSKTNQEKGREKALQRIAKYHEAAEAAKSMNRLRAPVVCVLGHVDTGKTKILDKLRRTNVQDGEAGGITQQIGATNVPMDAIREQTKMCKEFAKQELKVPGLLIIDTPGHESFSNLRSRGSSLCDLAILVVDIMHGLEPQTIESINILKSRKTPFVVALNKVDRLFGWLTNPHTDIVNTLKKQKQNTKLEFDERLSGVIVQLAEQGLNATLFSENKNQREYISLVPTSAHTGDGIGNLMALICELTQSMLVKRLMYSDELKATVMEVKAISGHGTTIDVILVNGKLQVGQTIVVAGQEGPIVTQIRSLLMPQPMHELRVKSQFESHKQVLAAQGCKIAAKDLEKALAGLPLYVANHSDEVEIYKEELQQMLKEVLGNVKISDKGVYVQASTLGSLEALLSFLKTSEIPYCGINIGPVHKKDIMKASVMLEHDLQYAVILAFDVKVEREAQELADGMGVKIFTADIIYHLFDRYIAYKDEFKAKKREELKHVVAFPCKLRVLPEHVYNSRDPIVVGVVVEAGFIKMGTLLCVPSKEFVDIGRVSSMEVNHKLVEKATKGQEVCIKIDAIPGEAPKLYGRHFEHTDLLVSRLTRQAIDAIKGYWRDEMTKGDWQLVMELKQIFEIL